MSTFYNPRRGRRPSSTDWLQILDVDGPFLAAPVVTDTWPDGLPALAQQQMDALRAASTLYDANPGTRDAFISHVLGNLLDWRTNLVTGPDAATYAVRVPEHHQTVEIGFALRGQDADGTVTSAPLLLGMILPPKTPTTGRAPAGSGTWTAGPADRLAHAMRARKVALGLVTNGETWTLVTLSKKDGKAETSALSTATWTRHAWLEEPQTLRAFVALLTRTRFYGVPDTETLPGLLSQSLNRQEEVTERLAEQSQAVVEMLVASIGRLDAHHQAEHGTRLLPADVGPAEVYQAAVTVLMRLVFLLYAEERGLLPLDDDTYASAYAVNTLADSLRGRATDHGEDALERTATGWYRLLALFRGVHRGARHEQLILPAYGGSLFDPDRFPWLEGRPTADAPLGSGDVPAIDDRTLLRALDSLQTLQFAKERRQVSYRSLDVEQIGYVYEGLLDQDALTATDWVVSIAVSDKDSRKNGPELLLADLEQRHAIGDEALAAWLVEQIKNIGGNRSKASLLKALTPLVADDKPRYARLVREACGNDDAITARVMPFAKLLRLDPRDLPVVYPPGSLFLADSTARANTGAVYTPRFLAEQVVETTLEVIAYAPGPLDTEDKSAWVLKTPQQILDLKVCDIAAGSGAFLVAATRYLAERLLESRRQYSAVALTATLDLETSVSEDISPPAVLGLRELALAEQDELDARRDVITHCIYGVDINHMAIEMAKLSLWLTSLDPRRPFSFLDDHLAVGDSLLGITSAQQLVDLHFDPKRGRKLHKDTLDLLTSSVERDLKVAAELRAQITQTGDRDSRDARTKQRLLRRASEVTARLKLVADGLSSASLAGGKDSDYLGLAALVSAASNGHDPGDQALLTWVGDRLQREVGDGQHQPAHFPLAFPEVFADGRAGFDAVVSNPPFVRGRSISAVLGDGYCKHLLEALCWAEGTRTADLIAYFVVRAAALISSTGGNGLIATNSVGQDDTAETGLRNVLKRGLVIYSAISSMKWPTAGASVHVSLIWGSNRELRVSPVLDGKPVPRITEFLQGGPLVPDWTIVPIPRYRSVAKKGSEIYGEGFTLDPAEAVRWIDEDSNNEDVLFPYLSARDLLQDPTSSPSRWVINFFDWPIERARRYVRPFDQVERLVRPMRASVNRAARRERWWQYGERAAGLYEAIGEKETVLALGYTTNTVQPLFVSAQQVFTNGLIVLPDATWFEYALLSSSAFGVWAYRLASTMGEGLRLAPSDIIGTFPFGAFSATPELDASARQFSATISSVRRDHSWSLTQAVQVMHDEAVASEPARHLRASRWEIDQLVLQQLGISGCQPVHADTRFGRRFLVRQEDVAEVFAALSAANQVEVLEGRAADPRGKKRPTPPSKTPDAQGNYPMLFGDDA